MVGRLQIGNNVLIEVVGGGGGRGIQRSFRKVRRGAVEANGPRPALSRCALTMLYPAATPGRMDVAQIRQATYAAPSTARKTSHSGRCLAP